MHGHARSDAALANTARKKRFRNTAIMTWNNSKPQWGSWTPTSPCDCHTADKHMRHTNCSQQELSYTTCVRGSEKPLPGDDDDPDNWQHYAAQTAARILSGPFVP